MNRPSTYSLLILAALILSACSSQTAQPIVANASLSDIPTIWTIQAKLGVRTSDDSASVTLGWQQVDDSYRIRVSGPLGQGSGSLEGNPQSIKITQGKKEPLHSNNPDQLVQDTFGWQLPLEHLPYWVRGLASPSLAKQEALYEPANNQPNNPEVLTRLVQSGWQVEYSRFRLAERWLMPHRIRATKGDVRLTLVVKRWEFPNPLLQSAAQ